MRSIFGGGQNRQRTQTTRAQPSTLAQPTEAPSQVRRHLPAYQRRPLPPRLSNYSTPAVQTCGWSSLDFMLGAGMVVIQPSTQKIVVVYDTERKYWFLPRGRKDTGESLEQAALREAYEETGYQVEFLPLYIPTHQPPPPAGRADRDELNIEPIYMTIKSWEPRVRRNGTTDAYGGEYLTMWYVGQIPDDAIPEEGTGMADEQNYKSHLLTFEEAMDNLWDTEGLVLSYVWAVFMNTENIFQAQSQATQPSTTGNSSSQD